MTVRNELSDRALLEYLLNKIRSTHEYLLDDPPISDERREQLRKLADALGDFEPPPEPERVTQGTVDLEGLLRWLRDEATAADLRAGFAPSFPGNALRSAADWIEIGYRPDRPEKASHYLTLVDGLFALRALGPLSQEAEAEIAGAHAELWETLAEEEQAHVETGIERLKEKWQVR